MVRTPRERMNIPAHLHRRSVSRGKPRSTPQQPRKKEAKEAVLIHAREATLEGGDHLNGTFAIVTDAGERISGRVKAGRKALLLKKVLGGRYVFHLQEKRSLSIEGDSKSQWTLLSIESLAESGISHEPEAEGRRDVMRSVDVPQQDKLERIVQVIRFMAGGNEVTARALNMPESPSSQRHIAYMKHAAKVLSLLNEDGKLLKAGEDAAALPRSKVAGFLALQFELSRIGRAWKKWAGVDVLDELDESTAVAFLRDVGLSATTAKRRGRTLSKWVLQFKRRDSLIL